MKLFVKRFLGIDINNSELGEALELYEEAKVAREFEVELIAEGVALAINGKD